MSWTAYDKQKTFSIWKYCCSSSCSVWHRKTQSQSFWLTALGERASLSLPWKQSPHCCLELCLFVWFMNQTIFDLWRYAARSTQAARKSINVSVGFLLFNFLQNTPLASQDLLTPCNLYSFHPHLSIVWLSIYLHFYFPLLGNENKEPRS